MSVVANASQMNFKTADLILKLEANRKKHVAEYNEAVIGYREKIGEALKEATKKFNRDNTIFDKSFVVTLPAPTSYEKEYSTIIEMLKFCTDDTINLDRSNFQNFILDEWHWKGAFTQTLSLYNNKLGK